MCDFCVGAYKHDVVVVTKIGADIHWGDYFVWVPIILIVSTTVARLRFAHKAFCSYVFLVLITSTDTFDIMGS